MARHFTISDVQDLGNDYRRIFADTSELVHCPLDWQKRGQQQTASGYGAKLTSSYMILFEGKQRRIYVTCFSNAGSSWFTLRGQKIFVGYHR